MIDHGFFLMQSHSFFPQGGPGASGVGFGNFAEIGPLNLNLEPRPHTWLQKAHLLFVDNPVGTGRRFLKT